MRVKSLASAPDRAGRYRVVFEDDSVVRLYKQTVQDFGLYPGRDLCQEELHQLDIAAGEMSAKMRAVRIVSASNVSKRDLEQRLIHKGEDPEHAKNAVRWMSELSLVDDAKTAEMVVSRCVAKGYGLARAKQELYEKRIPKEFWEDALAEYPDQSDKIMEYFKSKLHADADQRDIKRAVDALIRRGHSYGVIRRVLNELSLDREEFPEE